MSYKTIEEYERAMWEDKVRPAVAALIRAANGDDTWSNVAECLPFAHRFPLGDSEEPRAFKPFVDRPDSFRVGMSYVLYNTLDTPEDAVDRLTKSIVDKFEADKRWRTALPRMQLMLRTGPRFEISVWDNALD